MLDLYCYTGGFALNAARHGGAASILGIDASAAAIERARDNARRNGLDMVEFEEIDVTRKLQSLAARGERFGFVVCDPPKFAPTQRDLDHALRGYVNLNRQAVDVLEPGGILVTCSCSGLVDAGMFQAVISQAAELSGRMIQILEARGQSPDHPVSVACPESAYLKCLICRVG